MAILGSGDLSPRRRHRRTGRDLVALAGVVVVVAVLFFGIKALAGGSSGHHPSLLPVCKPAPLVKPMKPKNVSLTVLNGTTTSGLASEVSNELKARGFHVTSVGNTKNPIQTGTALVSYGPGKLLAAQAVAAEFTGAKIVPGSVPGVQLGVGPDFTALAGTSDVRSARQQFAQANVPATPTAAPTASPTCRPAPSSTPSSTPTQSQRQKRQ